MHRSLALALLLISPLLTRADYPIFWQRYTADPAALVWNGRLYLFCSHDSYDAARGYGYFMNDITCISTVDMKNWTDHGEVFSYRDVAWGATLTWAPQVVERDGRFYLYYGNGNKSIGVAVADNPLGPYKDDRTSPLVSSDTPGVWLYDGAGNRLRPEPDVPGAQEGHDKKDPWIFDPSAFIDPNDGRAYLYFGGGHPLYSRVIRLKDNLVEVDGSAFRPNTPGFFEASWMHYYAGRYYLSYSGHTELPTGIEYVVSDNPMYEFTRPEGMSGKAGVLLPNPPDNDDDNNHHSVVEYKGRWYVAYHTRSVVHERAKAAAAGVAWCQALDGLTDHRAHQYMRSVAIDEMHHNADGTLSTTQPTEDGLEQLEWVNPYARQEAEMMAKGWGIACSGGIVTAQHAGDYIRVRGVDFGSEGAKQLTALGQGRVEVRLDSLDGTHIATLRFAGNDLSTASATCKTVRGVHDLYFHFPKAGTRMDYWMFEQ